MHAIVREDEWDTILGNMGTLMITSGSLKRLTVRSHLDCFFASNDVFNMVIDAPAVEFIDIYCIVT
jgi:protein associated with RNAse G/E